MANPYLDIIKQQGAVSEDNPYVALTKNPTDVVGSAPRQVEKTGFAKILDARAAAKEASAAADKANSFGTMFKETVTGLPAGAMSIAKAVANDPKQAAYQAAMGLANGVTLGGVDYLERKAFTNAFKEGYQGDMTDKQIEDLATHTLAPQDPAMQAIRGGAEFASILVPYAGAEAAMSKGLAYAAPKFIKQYGTAAKILTNIGAWNAIGQTEESLKPADERNRKLRALIDTGLGIAFPVGEMTFRAIRPTIFSKAANITPVGSTETLVHEGEVLSQEALVSGAQSQIAALEARGANLSVSEARTLALLKGNLDNPEELYKIAQEGLPRPNIGDARAVIHTAAADGEKGLAVATNDVNALKDFIKGSNEITYKQVDSLGKDLAGNEILARHEFNPSTGTHTIYATSDVTASTLAHELGHYYDKELTKTVDGLSRILPAFEKNRAQIEDTLASLAVKRLGGEATGTQISAEIADIARKIIDESKVLSAARLGGVANPKISEQFADAVSQILTRDTARNDAPVLTSLLKDFQARKAQTALGSDIAKTLETSKEFGPKATKASIAKAEAKAPVAKIEPQKFDIVNDNTLGKVAVPRVGSTIKVSGKDLVVKKITQTAGGDMRLGVYDAATRKRSTIALDRLDNIGTLQGMAKDAKPRTRVLSVKPTREGNIKEVTKQLDRTPTGRQPDTIPFRAEKIAADQETETFLNTKVLPKIIGKERIGKSNEEILTRSLSSKMTEQEWNNILRERLGNLSEDVVKAKRIISDRVQNLRDGLLSKGVDDMSATEMKALSGEYEQLIETVEVFAGVRTELSNAFRSLGLEVAPGENDVLRQVVEQMQKVLGKEGDDFSFLKKALKLRENSIVDKYYNIWYPAILSGPKTTARNVVGNTGNIITETLSQLFSKDGRATFLDRVNAMVGASKESYNRARAILTNNEAMLSKFHEGPPLRRPDFKGKLAFLNNVEYVGRFLDAQDAFFSNIAQEGEIAALRKGQFTYGLADQETIDTINEAVSKAFAQRSTYRNQFDRTVFGEIGRIVTALKNSEIQSVKAVSNFVVPFVRTVANITDRKIDYIPFLNIWRVYRGEATPFIERRASRIVKEAGLAGAEADRVKSIVAQRLWHQQMGKMYMGMTVAGTLIPLAMAGRITGAGPKDKNERDTLMLKGWRPSSIILPGGVVLPYQNLGPLSGLLSMAGNIADGVKYGDLEGDGITSLIGAGLGNFMRGELDQSYLAGFSDIYDMISPYSYRPMSDILEGFALNAIPIPAAWTQTKDILKPQRYDPANFQEEVLNRIGLTGSLQPKLDAFGKPMYADMIWGLTPTMLNTDDKVLNWMDENNIFIGKPNRKQTIKDKRTGEKREMTPEEYTQFLSETGQAIYDKMEQVISSGALDRYTDPEKKKAKVQQIVSDIRAREKGGITF